MNRSTRAMFLTLIAALVAGVISLGRHNERLKASQASGAKP